MEIVVLIGIIAALALMRVIRDRHFANPRDDD